MKNTDVERLIRDLEFEEILHEKMFDIDELDRILDERDAAPFDAEWIRVHEAVQSKEADEGRRHPQVSRLAEAAFIRASSLSEQHEIASYISDDFELIGRALLVNYNDPWLSALLRAYVSGEIPHGHLKPQRGSLKEILAQS